MVREQLKIEFPAEGGRPAFRAELGPGAHVILGVNGSGKSHLLRHLVQQHQQWGLKQGEVAYVEGARTINMPPTLALNKDTLRFSAFTQTKDFHERTRHGELQKRLTAAIFRLQRATDLVYQRHSEAVEKFIQEGGDGELGDLPRRERSPLDKLLTAFTRVFPQSSIQIDGESLAITARKGELVYPVARLSDGEKQCFALLADLFCAGEGLRLVVVDEPELNLHADLATTLWSEIEDELPGCVFVYATHAVPFASRSTVDTVWYVDDGASHQIPDIADIPLHLRRALLGTLPALSASRRHLFVEGEENSFDEKLYRWLLDGDVVIHPVGGCTEVAGAVRRAGVWSRIAPNIRVAGVIDRDFRPDHRLSELEAHGVVVLPKHEAESLLCRPDLLARLAASLGTVDEVPTEAEIEAWIREEWEKEKLFVQTRRIEAALALRLAPSVPRVVFDAIIDDAEATEALKKSAAEELAKATSNYSDLQVRKQLLRARARPNPDISEILRLMPGKNLLNALAPRIGARDARSLLNKAVRELKADELFSDLIAALRGAFSGSE